MISEDQVNQDDEIMFVNLVLFSHHIVAPSYQWNQWTVKSDELHNSQN